MNDFKVFASCHNHSTFSDGEYTPELLARMAKNMGHGGIILTDHDTVKGSYFIAKEARKQGILTLLGCEFSTYHTMKDGKERGIHLLGFDFNPDHSGIKKILETGSGIQTSRSEMLFKWGQERGTLRGGITWQDVLDDHPYHDYFCNNEVFDSFLKRGIYRYDEYDDIFLKPNFSYKLGLEDKIYEITGKSYHDIRTEDVIVAIKEAGGVPVVAHPQGYIKYTDELLDMGVMGFETRHSMLSPEEHIHFENVCRKRKLYNMGGADHENVLGGLLAFGDAYSSPYEMSGIDEEAFMKIYRRTLG